MSRILTSFILLSVWSIISVKAQDDNYETGSVVTLNGDTLTGTINNERWIYSPKFVQFKDAAGNLVTYLPKDIKSFSVGVKFVYLSESVRYDSTSNKIDELPFSPQPAYKTEVLFIKLLVRSELSLMSYYTAGRTHFFMQRTDGNLEELINHRFNSKGTVLENRGFITQLQGYFSDCAALTVSPKISYSASPISKLIIKYNDCRQKENQVFNEKEKTIVTSGLVLIAAYDQYRPSFDGGVGYGAGGFIDLQFPNHNYKLSLNSELAYRKTGKQENTVGEVYKIQSIQWSNLIRMRLLPNNKNLLVGGGLALSAGLPDEYYRSSNGKLLGTTAKNSTALLGDVCIKVSENILIDIRYENGDSVVIKDYWFGNGDTKRSSSVRLSLAVQF